MNTAILASSEAKIIPRSKNLELVGENTGDQFDLKNNIAKTKQPEPIFYRLFIIEGEDTVYQEFGVGYTYLYKKKPHFYRDELLKGWSKNSGQIDNRKPKRLKQPVGHKIFVQTGTPESYKDMLSIPNSVLCCSDPHKPLAVELQDKTLLGRVDDIIQSIDKYELWSILSEYVDDNLIPAVGSIRFNPVDSCFEGYDGERWRSLMWGEK